MPTRLLLEEGHDIVVFYANSNIAPRAEYEKRLAELERYAHDQGFAVVEGAYDPARWENEVAPIGEALKDFSPALTSFENGENALPASVAELLDDERRKERCRACYRMRLEEAASVAREGGYDALSTTLAVSPYQFTDVIREELKRACANEGIEARFQDYRPYYDEATRISRELGMYRQNYCGCRFSIKEGEATRAFIKAKRKAEKQAKRAKREVEEAERLKRAEEKRSYERTQARKRAILKSLREAEGPNRGDSIS